ncbi:hypothetical protein M422DRAFT_24575 [Sphaerobolus stellatus SS14]|nr:hypothetical protein M422DRAFT_24575 [Sphaerobolus stellatus SS14]
MPPICFPFGKSNAHSDTESYTTGTESLSRATTVSTLNSLPEKSNFTRNPASPESRPSDIIPSRPGTIKTDVGRSASRSVNAKPTDAASRAGTTRPIDGASRAGTILSRAGTNPTQKPAKSLLESSYERRLAEIQPVKRRVVDTAPRLAELRKLMQKEKLDYYIVPSVDAHGSEYNLAPCDNRREWISGFTGSSGTALISLSNAYLFTDSRYYIQAARELDENWSLQKTGWEGVKHWDDWLIDRAKGAKVGVDSRLIPYSFALKLRSELALRDSVLVYPWQNLIDLLWKERPPRPPHPIHIHPLTFAGEDAQSKLDSIRMWIRSKSPPESSKRTQADMPIAAFFANLYDIAWVLNLRGSDLPYSPVFLSYLFISMHSAVLFIENAKIPNDVRHYLDKLGVITKGYSDVWPFLRGKDWGVGKVLISPDVPFTVARSLQPQRYIVTSSYVTERRAIKNETELMGMREAYLRDSVAFVRFLAWLDIAVKQEEVDEFQASEQIDAFRVDTDLHGLYDGPAYETISATGSNAALPHYTPTVDTGRVLNLETPYLIDSGGQYKDGTCDTTRTVHFAKPTYEHSEAYTRVLQGHISLASAIFPEGTLASRLDVLARKALWKHGMNYGHSTGSGVGSFLSARESAVAFHKDVPLQPGHTISNEPGYYKEKEFGVRIESTYAVVAVSTEHDSHDRRWLGFERLTHVPIQLKMVRQSFLSKEERDWILAHNVECLRILEPFLQEDKATLKWLRKECQAKFPNEKSGFLRPR